MNGTNIVDVDLMLAGRIHGQHVVSIESDNVRAVTRCDHEKRTGRQKTGQLKS
ncbi:hypothetical protein DPMN_012319 [Dreissena polymorpha]|uniref:Uncharacterized protein n=1 Tax=Dreissena polymorpha TaxID=45954 RepID=A0A9D4S394_DREPO|nr:hypothetical protein DPMN_012319 [Dreissena polymorpha]